MPTLTGIYDLMLKLILLLLALLLPQQEETAQLQVLWDQKPVITTGETIEISVVFTGADQEATLLPLAVKNFSSELISSRSSYNSDNGLINRVWQIQLKPLSIGSARINEIQVELASSETSSEPKLLTWPEITFQVEKPFSFLDYWPALLAIALATLAGGGYLFWRQRLERQNSSLPSQQEALRIKITAEIDHYKIRAQWTKVVDKSMQGISHEIFPERIFARLIEEELETISKDHPEFPAAYRLWEETRYGGFEPGKQEANFAVKTYRQIVAEKQRKEKK
jgi:hypothetical protein